MKLSEIRHTLREIRVVPVKTLGQNFLHDQNLARWMVQQAGISAGGLCFGNRSGSGRNDRARARHRRAEFWRSKRMARLADFLRDAFRRAAASKSFTATRWSSKCGRLFPRGPGQVVRQSALLRLDATSFSLSGTADSYHAGIVDVTDGSCGTSFGCAAFQRLRNSYSDRPGAMSGRVFADSSAERISAAT